MLQLPSALRAEFETCLRHAGIPKPAHAAYTKWLRSYLDFCQKYHVPQAQRQQASHAVSLYDELVRLRDSHTDVPSLKNDAHPEKALDLLSPRLGSLPSEPSTSPKASAAAKSPDQPSLPPTTRTLPREFPGSPSTPGWPMTSGSGTTLRKP
jgi:hypothetical protein